MTDITQHSLQSQTIPEEPTSASEQDVNSIPEEGDITEAAASIIHVNRTPSPPQDTHERLHQNGGSDSEEDMTEENVPHYDVGHLATHMDNLSTDANEHATSAAQAETTPSDREEHTTSVQEDIPTIVREHADPDPESSDGQSIAPTDIVNNGSRPVAAAAAAAVATAPATTTTTTSSSNTMSVPNTSNSTSHSPRGRSVSSVSPSTLNGNLLPRAQRVWEMDRQAPECRRCHRRFNFLVRRHHCRRCGQIVCDKCSSNRIRLPVEELIEDPMVSPSQYPLLASQSQRVCDTCYREPIRRSSESHQRRGHRSSSSSRPVAFGSQMRRTDSSQSLMIDCPVCGSTFLGMQKGEQEEHLQRCLNVGSPPVQSPRYIVYQLSQESTQIGDECPICFEEFEEGDKISRMICLCSYHQKCLASWLQKGKGCPVHYDSLQI